MAEHVSTAEELCARCGKPLGDGPIEQMTDPGTGVLRSYHVECVPPALDEQV